MYNNDLHSGLPFYPPVGHVPWLGIHYQTTVNPRDVLLTQPSSGLLQLDRMPHDIAGSHRGYPGDIPQETLQPHPPVWPSQPMNHQHLDPFFGTNGDFTRQSTGAVRPVRQRFRGVRVDDPVSTSCQWQPQGSLVCGQEIKRKTIPQHLADHGIWNMRRDLIIQCHWRGCGISVTRQSITRHLREVHLGLKRKSCAHTSSTTLFADVN